MRALSPPQSFHSVGCAFAPPIRPMPASANTHAVCFFITIPEAVVDREGVRWLTPIDALKKTRHHKLAHILVCQNGLAAGTRPAWTYAPVDVVMTSHNRSGDNLKRFLPVLIVAAMILGVLVGFLINTSLS